MAAQSGKLFKELLCDGRAQPVDSTDPVTAKTIDDLKKQVLRLKSEIESERSESKELQWSHERTVRSIREESEKKLERSLEALSRRKDDERITEVSQVKERLLKQNQHELRSLRVELEEEMKRLEKRLTREREESMRKVLDVERKKTEEELSHYLPENSVVSREEHLKAEIFRLGVDVERLEFQVSNLQRENREQINLLKKANQEHKMELDTIKKKNQAEAARDLAQLKLAEQIIQEKERHIQEEEYRVDMALKEKEALVEELAGAKSRKTLDGLGREEAVQSPTSGKRQSVSGGGGVLQRRVEELESALRKLDEERRQLKQENASLRKAAVKEGGGVEGDAKTAEEKLKRLRKRNAELVALARQLDDKMKSLKMENDQLKVSGGVSSSSVVMGGGGGEGDVRRSLSRQHAKDISDYTKQLLTKDRELETLRTRLSKYEVNGKARYEPTPELESRVRSMAMERLRMEKVMVQLYSKVSNPLEVGEVTRREMASETREMERLFDENKTLRQDLELLKSQARMEDVDHAPQSLPTGGGRGTSEREKQLVEENSKLQARLSILAKSEKELNKLQTSLNEAESARASYEQQNRGLTQQLKQAQQLAQEMDAVQEMCVELEKEVAGFNEQLKQRDSKITQLEKSYQTTSESLSDSRQEADVLRVKVEELEEALRGKQDQIKQLASELDSQPPPPSLPTHQPPPPSHDVSLQTSFDSPSPQKPSPEKPSDTSHPTPALPTVGGPNRVKDRPSSSGERRVKSAGRSRRVRSPVKRSDAGEADTSLDNEMRELGFELTDSYDSSEGMGFSDTNLEGSSALLLDDDEGAGHVAGGDGGLQKLAWVVEEGRPAGDGEEEEESRRENRAESGDATSRSPDLAVGAEPGDGVRVGEVVKTEGVEEEIAATSGPLDTDLTVTRTTDEGELSPEPPTATATATAATAAAAAGGDSSSESPPSTAVSVFIAKYSYSPSEMSPNPNYEQELAIAGGDYLYVFGEMDADGFYFSQLPSGESGLVPSNFVEKVEDREGDVGVVLARPPARSRARRMSDLQDIPEVEEDVSSASTSSSSSSKVPPPTDLELRTQYVEGDKYCVTIQWSSPPSLSSSSSPSSQHQVTYHVYVDGEFRQAVGGVSGVMATQLDDIPRQQLVKISVRTVTDEGQSPDPKKIVVINPQYPEPPTRVQVSLTEPNEEGAPSIMVEWAPSRVLGGGAQISGYVILVNNTPLSQLSSRTSSDAVVCGRLQASHLSKLSLLPEERLVVSVRAESDQYQSLDSAPVVLPRELFDRVVAGSNKSREHLVSCGDGALVGSGGEERGSCSVETGHVTSASGHVTTNGPQLNGCVNGDGEEVDGTREMIKGGPRYYIATFSYNPSFHSPNEETAEDELAFRDGDVITGCSEVDEEGFFEGVLRGKRGLVPSNMVELVTEPDQLDKIQELMAEQQCRSPDPLSHLPTVNGGDSVSLGASWRMRALFGYNPVTDSPNENKEEELCIEEGDIVSVFGKPDEDGYYQGELKGKTGLVPSNFLEDYVEGESGEGGEGVRRNAGGGLGMEIFAANEEDMEQAKRIIEEASDSLKRSGSLTSSTDSSKGKKGIFSKGKGLLSKSIGKK